MSRTTLVTKLAAATFRRDITIDIAGVVKGSVGADFKVKKKQEVVDMVKDGWNDFEIYDEVVTGVHGLGTNASGDAMAPEDGVKEARDGELSGWLVQAIVADYLLQYGEARRGNSGRRR